jgi:hypothetical protein
MAKVNVILGLGAQSMEITNMGDGFAWIEATICTGNKLIAIASINELKQLEQMTVLETTKHPIAPALRLVKVGVLFVHMHVHFLIGNNPFVVVDTNSFINAVKSL